MRCLICVDAGCIMSLVLSSLVSAGPFESRRCLSLGIQVCVEYMGLGTGILVSSPVCLT